MKVRLGRCTKLCADASLRDVKMVDGHLTGCAAKPIDVTCSIRGKTWAESEAVADEVISKGIILDGSGPDGLMAAVRARWALVKELVTGGDWDGKRETLPLFRMRDAVYAALVEKFKAEQQDFKTDVALFDALKECDIERVHVVGPASYAMSWQDPGDGDAVLNSRAGLASFVDMIIDRVAAMP